LRDIWNAGVWMVATRRKPEPGLKFAVKFDSGGGRLVAIGKTKIEISPLAVQVVFT